MAMMHAVDHAPHVHLLGGLGHGRQHGPALQTGSLVGRGERVEVIPVPQGSEDPGGVGGLPHGQQLRPGDVMRRGLEVVASGGHVDGFLSGGRELATP